MPTTTSSGPSAAITASSFAKPASVAARSTVVTGRATVPVGSETATPVRAEPKVEREDFQLMAAVSLSRPACSASRTAPTFFPPASARVGSAAAPATDDRAQLADDRDRVEVGERLVEVHDERDLTVIRGREHDCQRILALAHLVGEVAQRTAARAGHFRNENSVLLVLPQDLHTRLRAAGLRLWLLRLTLELLDLGAHGFELLRASFEHRPPLAGGHGLDAARTAPDGAFAQNHERSDLGGRADVRASAELGRVLADLDDPHPLRRTSRRRASSRRACGPPRSA